MKRILLISIFTLFTAYLFSQGDLASLETPIREISTEYDGTENYLKKKVYLYIGQTLRFSCDSRLEQKEASFVLGFTESYKIGEDRYGPIYPKTYHPSSGGLGTDYHKIVNNLFKVLDVFSHPKANSNNPTNKYNNIYYLKMLNLSLRDTVYYEYIAEDKDRYFPFVAMKHLKYLKNKYKGQFYQVLGEQYESTKVTCFKTRKTIEVNGKTWWKCIDLITNKDNCKLSLVLESQKQQIIVPVMFMKYIFKCE